MDKIRIQGGVPLKGEVEVSGAKNAALPLLISSLLTDQPSVFTRVPRLQDIASVTSLLKELGVGIEVGDQVRCDARTLTTIEAPYDIVRKMRASVLVLGPLLARQGEAKVSLPGGCAIGARPINIHLDGLKKLGAEIDLNGGYVIARAKVLRGAAISFEFPSVGATENLLMACVLAKGESVLKNCAREPEIVNLADSLRSMGAKIQGDGTSVIHIQGVDSLGGAKCEVIGDRIEAGTYLAAGLATRGDVTVKGISGDFLTSVLTKLEEAGARVESTEQSVRVQFQGQCLPIKLVTQPFPGFPTDMQAQFMALTAVAEGTSTITESIFENRFMHVPELMRLGADIDIRGNTAVIHGKNKLKGAPLMATDLRASAGLVIGGLCAEGETIVNRIYHLDRGYESLEKKLSQLGARVERIS